MLGCSLWNTTSAETKFRLRAMGKHETVKVYWWGSPAGAPNDRGVGNVLSEEGGKVQAVVSKFGLKPGLRAVWASLLCVQRADRDVQGGVPVAKGGGEGVGGPKVGTAAWISAVTELSPRVASPRWHGRRPWPESQSGRQHRVWLLWARRTLSAGGPTQRTPRARPRIRDGGLSRHSRVWSMRCRVRRTACGQPRFPCWMPLSTQAVMML